MNTERGPTPAAPGRASRGDEVFGSTDPAATSRRIDLRDNRIDSGELFAGSREIVIVHGRETYRLRLTAQNKLILTK
ncbi:MAG: hemin uptake protein HemP [Pseudolabrys sp.]|nr:hemin uptake protein HemP [Pseudolabrys sp.]